MRGEMEGGERGGGKKRLGVGPGKCRWTLELTMHKLKQFVHYCLQKLPVGSAD